MKYTILILYALTFIMSGSRLTAQAPLPKSTSCDVLISNVGLFDGKEDRGIVDIAISNGSIIKIASRLKNYTARETIDGTGKYIIPGLINAHVHLWNKSDLWNALHSGIFAVIDLHSSEGSDASFRTLRDSIGYAAYYSSGYAATVPKGHPTQIFPIETINDSVSPEQFVRHRLDRGADLIKIVSGNLRPGSLWYSNPALNFNQIQAITNAAKNNRKMAVVHVSQVEETVTIAAMGVNGFAHLWSYGDTATEAQIRSLKRNRVFIIPTALIQEKAWEIVDKNPNDKNEFKGALSPMPVVYKEIRRLNDAGIPIIAGTDPPNFGINYTDDLLKELAIYSRAGLSNKEVLQTATGNPSKAFPFLNGIGTVKEGAQANCILLNANPLTNLSALKNIHTIWKNGVKVQ